MAASGTLTNWLRQLAGSPPYAQLLAEAASADGLVIVPYFSGRANPDLRPPRPMICGLTRTHGRGHLYRAALEATAYGVRHNLETMADTGARPERAVAVGGGTRGQLWTRIACDVIGQVQQVPRYTRGASYGDALLAARAAGRATPDTDWCDIATTVEPDQRRTERDDEFNTLYRKLYPASRETAHALAGLQQREAVDPERSASLS
jgi:xylulokinase